MIDSGVPSIAFLIYYDITKHVSQAAVVAIALSLALTVIRLIRRETLQHALSGVFIVLVCAFISHRTGKAKDFYLPGLIINTAYCLVRYLARTWHGAKCPLAKLLTSEQVGSG